MESKSTLEQDMQYVANELEKSFNIKFKKEKKEFVAYIKDMHFGKELWGLRVLPSKGNLVVRNYRGNDFSDEAIFGILAKLESMENLKKDFIPHDDFCVCSRFEVKYQN